MKVCIQKRRKNRSINSFETKEKSKEIERIEMKKRDIRKRKREYEEKRK